MEVAAFTCRLMPLADTITFWMAAPIYVAALSPFLLGEHVGWRRWTAIGLGFVGVLIALQPSSETLSAPALIAIAGSLCFALMMVAGRALRNSADIALVFWPTVGAAIFGVVASLFSWVPPTGFDYALLALLGVVAMVAHVFTNRSLIYGGCGRRDALSIHAAGVGRPVRLAVLQRNAETVDADRRGLHRCLRPVRSSSANRSCGKRDGTIGP